jgi:alpha-mannosidase
MKRVITLTPVFILFFAAATLRAQEMIPAPKYNLYDQPVLYTVGYAHLDTEWRWDYEETVNQYLKATLDDNFARFEKYKPYVFTFSGARRYRMMKEYYPSRYEKMKKYIAQGRWFVGGSSVDECDANVPSPEALIRQVLYGNGYFRAEFGKESVDFLLPDCFGFQAHLPSALAHAGVTGFSTQKLSWGSANGIPFNIGNWTGPDGKGLVAALNATDYTGRIQLRLDTSKYWATRINENGNKYGVYADYRYYGVGDVGGAPRESDVKNAIESLDHPDSRFKVYLTSSDQLFRDLSPAQKEKLPSYTGDLLLTEHSAGSLTSQAYMKRWNRKNELLARAAEPVAVMANWLGAIPYPKESLNEAWWLVLGSQMHDILPGTCIPKAYEYAWNDEVIALNRFAAGLEHSAGAVIRALDTRGEGVCLVVYNPMALQRDDVVEAEVQYPGNAPQQVRLRDAAGKEVPVQVTASSKNSVKVLFRASVPALGMTCYDLIPAKKDTTYKTTLSAQKNLLDNEFYKVTVDNNGDISSIIDKKAGKELLSAPARLEFLSEHPEYWPAWNMDWKDRKLPAIDRVKGPAVISVTEKGPVRATIRVERSSRNSYFIQEIQLSSGSPVITVKNRVEWLSRGVSLKATFPLTASNPVATYNLGLGTIERGNNDEKKYEVPSREWFDLTDKSGSYGVSILEDCKFGSDKPNDKTLRLTLLYTPVTNFYHDQATQDWGIHEFSYGIYGHKGDWRSANSEVQGRAFNQPLIAFRAPAHDGFLGRTFSFMQVSTPQVDVRAVKKSEAGDALIVRVQELLGRDAKEVTLSAAGKITSAWEVDGQERRIADLPVKNGKVVFDLTKYNLRSFALKLEKPAGALTPPESMPLPLAYDQDVVSTDRDRRNGWFDQEGLSIPAELFPAKITVGGIPFNLGPSADGAKNVMVCKGQKLALPKTGNYDRIYILAAALTDTAGVFRTGSQRETLRIAPYSGKIGQFDRRTWDRYDRISGLDKGFIRRDEVAWFATHLHKDTLNLPHKYAYLFLYELEMSQASGTLQLPENEAIKIFAVTLAANPYDQVSPVQPLYDDFDGRNALTLPLPVRFVNTSMEPLMKVNVHRKRNLGELPGRVTMKDYADIHQPNGVNVYYYFSGADTNFKKLKSGMSVPPLNDGMYDLMPTDSVNDLWSAAGEGRVVMTLQREIELDSIHCFTALDNRRGPQSFSLWAYEGENLPSTAGDPKAAGWKFLVLSPPPDLWGSTKGLFTLTPLPGQNVRFRYLMWVSEDSGHGPFYFREVDVFEKQK